MKLRTCDKCACAGLIRVMYHDGQPFDVAICDCQAGQIWRHQDDIEGTIRARFSLSPEHQVALAEDFDPEETPMNQVANADFTAAGKVGKVAKL